MTAIIKHASGSPQQERSANIAAQTGIWRWVVEMSSMSNNDEIVVHADRDISYEEFAQSSIRQKLGGAHRSPRLVFSRPVFAIELEAGLDAEYVGDRREEKRPRIASTLDGLYRFFRDVECRLRLWRPESRTATKVVADIVAYSFYDCMSGGMDRTCALACRAIVQRYGCDLAEPVYPGTSGSARGRVAGQDVTGWYTLGDWMRETAREGADEKFLQEVGPLFGQLVQQKLLTSSH